MSAPPRGKTKNYWWLLFVVPLGAFLFVISLGLILGELDKSSEVENTAPPAETENWAEIRAQAEEDRQARQKGKDYLTNLGYEILESSEFKFTVTLPGFDNHDLAVPPENWETVHNDFISAASGASEEMGRTATIYLQDSDGHHYLTMVGDQETYNVYEVAPDPTPAPTSNSNYNKYNSSSAVWISDHGRRYHSKSSCSEMENPQLTSYGYAIEQGYTACQKCH